jgi:heterodisulfide reductase subunit C
MGRDWKGFYRDAEEKKGTPYIYIRRRADDLKLGSLIHREAKDQIQLIFTEVGHSVRLDENVSQLRMELDLPKLPPTVLSYPEKLDEVREIVRRTTPKKSVVNRVESEE